MTDNDPHNHSGLSENARRAPFGGAQASASAPASVSKGRSLSGAKVVVVGLGLSGEAAALWCAKLGAQVTATDARIESAFGNATLDALRSGGVSLVLGGHAGVDLASADLVVVSPGVPQQPFLLDAEQRGARIVSELELASWYVDADLLAVGGTNGKSTTTELAATLASTSGRPVFAGGNLGTPLSRALLDEHPGVGAGGVAVVEVSSFQLERVAGFRPRASILLNITPDHLDRYPSFEAYAIAKGGAFRAQRREDFAIVPHGDALCARIASLGYGTLERVDGPHGEASIGLEIENGDEVLVDRVSQVRFPRRRFQVEGRHHLTNLCAAWAAVRSLGIDARRFPEALERFRGLPHRSERAGEVAGVSFYDDSKGTNVGAAVTALLGVREPKAVLIAGGRDKGGSYEPLVEALRVKGRALVVIGEAADAIATATRITLGDRFPIERASSMEDAVDRALTLAQRGDAVLLSPACSSFDMFRDYKHRGDAFVAAVAARAEAAVAARAEAAVAARAEAAVATRPTDATSRAAHGKGER